MDLQQSIHKTKYDLIVIGCSAGGIEALQQILSGYKFDLPIAVVQHRGIESTSVLIEYISGACGIQAVEPDDKEPLQNGKVYFAPSNYHLMIGEDKHFNLSIDHAVCYSRPSIDVLFQSAAEVYKSHVVGIVMSGANQDGAKGLLAIKNAGGLAVVQNPSTAVSSTMPEEALKYAQPQLVLDLSEIKKLIHTLGEVYQQKDIYEQ